MNNSFFYKHLHFILTFIFFLFFAASISFYIDFNRHWTAFYDQELILIYNALLFNNGIAIEYIDHPGYFTILNLSLFYKFLSILNVLSIHKLTLLNTENFDQSFQNLIFYARIFSLICFSLFLSSTYFLFNVFTRNKAFSFFLSLALFSFPGTIFHIGQMRTELITMIFVVISISCLKIFFQQKLFSRIWFLVLFFVFLYFSMLNKMQVFFLYPLFLIPIFFCDHKIYDFNIEKFKFLENRYFPIFLIFLVLFYLYISNHTLHPFPWLSGIMILINIFLLNLFFYYIYLNKTEKLTINLVVINSIFILVFFIIKNLLILHPSTSEIIFVNLTRVMDMVMYIPDPPNINETSDLLSNLIIKFIMNSFLILKNVFFKLNIHSSLIILNIFLTIFLRKKLGKLKALFNLSCLLAFLLIIIINSFRSNGSLLAHYEILSDFLLILSFCNFANLLKINHAFIFFIIIFSISFKQNYETINYYKDKKDDIELFCSNNFLYHWLKKVDKNYYLNFCADNKTR